MTGEKLVLAVDDDQLILAIIGRVLEPEGFRVISTFDSESALEIVREQRPDLVISDVDMPGISGLEFVRRLRSDPELMATPVIFLSSLGSTTSIVAGLELGGDDYVTKPFAPVELVARVRAKLERVPVPAHLLPTDARTGLLSAGAFRRELTREHSRIQRGGAGATLACVSLHELEAVRMRLGPAAAEALLRRVADRVERWAKGLELVGREGDLILVLMPETGPDAARKRLDALSAVVARGQIAAGGAQIRVTPVIGLADGREAAADGRWLEMAVLSCQFAADQRDLQPVAWDGRVDAWAGARSSPGAAGRGAWARVARRMLLPFQVATTLVVGLALPFALYWSLDAAGRDITEVVYLIVVGSLLLTGALIWLEGFMAFAARRSPPEPREAYPAATAIIAAYLPNEAATIIDTLEAFFALEYPADLQVILAYNTPRDLPIEGELAAMAARRRNFLPFRVEASTSKAQNVNAALGVATGQFIGVFDADHQPRQGSFQRAWGWLSNGYDVVQGHCMVRNGDASFVARLVAVEFEAIYAVSHPGRAALHGFGVFGGSNGYWRTDRLHRIRMRSAMLTEDIDSSLRVIEQGGRIASDPGLVSAELATTTVKQLWNQRIRWAQGWHQVSLRHFVPSLRNRNLTLRNKLGLFHLLLWREAYPWISLQIVPIATLWAVQGRIDWFVPIFVATTLFTLAVGPGQTFLSYLAAAPEVRRHRLWFLAYLLAAPLYSEFKNLIARTAQVKHAMGERNWRVTPRTLHVPQDREDSAAA